MGSNMVVKAYWGWGKHEDIFSSATARHVSNWPEATCHQPELAVNTPVPPPTNTREKGLRHPPAPFSMFSPFMCIPSKASGALPNVTQSMSSSVSPAESRAIFEAS